MTNRPSDTQPSDCNPREKGTDTVVSEGSNTVGTPDRFPRLVDHPEKCKRVLKN